MKPPCGRVQAVSPSFGDFLLGLLGILSAIAAAAGALDAAEWLASVAAFLGLTLIGLFAVLGAVFIVIVIFWFRARTCGEADGEHACWAGVVVEIRRAFSSVSDHLLPFQASPDRADVVLRERYWHLVQGNAAFIHCHNDSDASPILRCFFRTRRLCAAITGALIGAIVAAVGVAVAAAILAGVLGCALVLPLCLALAILAFLIGALIALIGAAIGGAIGRAGASDDGDTEPGGADSSAVLGAIVTMTGNILRRDDYDGARVAWYAETVLIHGEFAPEQLPISFSEVEDLFDDITDGCEGL